MKNVRQIFLSGEAGYHNLGDEGMALASASRLRSYFPDAKLVATGLDPLGAVLRHQAKIVPWPLLPQQLTSTYSKRLLQKTGRKLGAHEDFMDPVKVSFDRIFEKRYRNDHNFRFIVSEIEKSDFVFDMGHGGLNDVFDPFMLCFLYYLAGRLAKPLFISGQSIGPLWRTRSKHMLYNALGAAHTIGLRDHQTSYNILVNEIGLDPSRHHILEIGDDTLDLLPQKPDSNIFSLAVEKLINSGDFFAVQWRGTDYTNSLSMTEQLLSLIEAIKYIYQRTHLMPVFIPLSWEMSGDILTAVRIKDYLQGQIPFFAAWEPLSVAETKWILGKARLGLGISYHFHVFLLSQGIPSIGVYTNTYYDIKLNGVFSAFNHIIKPLPYTNNLVSTPEFSAALDVALNIIPSQQKIMLEAAEAQRTRWHSAFKRFAQDNHLQ